MLHLALDPISGWLAHVDQLIAEYELTIYSKSQYLSHLYLLFPTPRPALVFEFSEVQGKQSIKFVGGGNPESVGSVLHLVLKSPVAKFSL